MTPMNATSRIFDFNHKIKNPLIIQKNHYWSHKIINISIFIYIILLYLALRMEKSE